MKDVRNRVYRFDQVEIDVQNLRVTVGSEVRPLEPKSFRLLLFLLENPGRALPKEEIMTAVWSDAFVSDNSLARAITQIRKALEDDSKAPRYVETVPSVGYRFVADLKDEIQEDTTAETPVTPPDLSGRRSLPVPWLVAGVAVAIAIAALVFVYFRGAASANLPEMRVEIQTPATDDPRSFALSPDGRKLAYVATTDSQSRLWVRQLAATKAQALTITEGGAAYPFWSPDSRYIGFFSGGKIKRIDAAGGLPQTLTDAKSGRGATWNEDGVILFSPGPAGALLRVTASGGDGVAVTKLEPWQAGHRFPWFLPDGRHYLYYAEGSPEKPGPGAIGSIYLGSLDSGEYKRLTAADTAGLYMLPGWLLWVQAGVLVARRLDIARGELYGDTYNVADPVFFDTSHARLFSVSATGLVTYRNGTPVTQLRWFDRSGKALGALAEPAEKDGYIPSSARISPDGRRVAVVRRVHEQNDIWLMQETQVSRFTFNGSGSPVWSPDSRQLAFDGNEKHLQRFFTKPADGAQKETAVTDDLAEVSILDDWSPDGRFLLFRSQGASSKTGFDLWTLQLEGDRKPQVFLRTKFDEKYGRFSPPDGRWVAYSSNESGRAEVYVRAFADAGAGPVRQVSLEGGLFPAWRHDGKELYWVGPGGRMMAAPIAGNGTTLEPGAPVVLFQVPILGGGLDVNTGGEEFDVAPDGRLLINTVRDSAATAITLLQNWKPK